MGLFKNMKEMAELTKSGNMNLDLEVHISKKKAYRINQQYMVPAGAQLGPGVELPLRVDKEDPKKIEIDWNQAPRAAAEGEIRPA